MKALSTVVLLFALGSSGCASAPVSARPPVAPWPASVSETCPRRATPLCCFRTQAIRAAMGRLAEAFRACHRPDRAPLQVTLRIETRGGAPACVEPSPQRSDAARCLAKAVARHLAIPNSDPEEACSFSYPVSFQQAAR